MSGSEAMSDSSPQKTNRENNKIRDADERVQMSGSSLNAIFDALSHRRRRHILSYLHDSPTSVFSFDELVDVVANREAALGEQDRKRVAINLHHVALPKLADSGVLEYDSRGKTVRYRGHSALETCLAYAVNQKPA